MGKQGATSSKEVVTPYRQGEEAFHAGKRRKDNPHHMSTAAHDSWDDGWTDAEDAKADDAD